QERRQHPGVVRGRTVHPLGRRGHPAVDVPAADDDRDLNAARLDASDLGGEVVDRLLVEPVVSGAHQRLAGQLQQDATADGRTRLPGLRGGLFGLDAHPSWKRSNSRTSAPSSARAWPTLLPVSWIQVWSASTRSAKKRLFSIPSTIFSRACSGFESTSSEFAK